jgi:SHAQKYF class myb-like DNA-binding protein
MAKKIKFFCSLQKKENKKQGRWSQEEQERFLKGCYFFKNDWEKIKEYIKTRTIPQIRSHAQKYLIKICRKYSIKLSKKKFSNRLSKHLDITKMPYKGKSNISNMSIYEKNILEMFNYYNREVIHDEKNIENKNNINNNQFKGISEFENFNNSANANNISINLPQNHFNIDNLNNSINFDNNINLLEKDYKNDIINNNFLFSINQSKSLQNSFPPNILINIQNNNNIKPLSSLSPSTLIQNSNDSCNNLYDYNIPINYINYQNKLLLQNDYELYLMQNISYYNSLLLNYIKSNQKINENILFLLGYNSNKNINSTVNNYNINSNFNNIKELNQK